MVDWLFLHRHGGVGDVEGASIRSRDDSLRLPADGGVEGSTTEIQDEGEARD